MAQKRLPVRKIREVLRLKAADVSNRRIADATGCSRSSVERCLRRATQAGIGWPLPDELDDTELEARLYPKAPLPDTRPAPDFAALHRELSRPGVTRMLLWQEYKASHPDGWQYSVFCDRYRRWLATQDPVLRLEHAPGEKLFVDYAGQTVPVIDRYTGEERQAQIFVAVLGHSNYTYAEASWSQTLPDWLESQARALEFLGELNEAIAELLEELNRRPFQKLEGCRLSRFTERDQPLLSALPVRPYRFAEWRKAKVHPDYHIEVKRAYYSVPYRLIGQRVDVRLSSHSVEIFHRGKPVASHPRAKERGRRATADAHRPPPHAAVIAQSMERVLKQARRIGPATAEVLKRQAAHRKHPEETLRSAQGILRLARDFTPGQLEAACIRALEIRSYSYRTVRTLLQTPPPEPTPTTPDVTHDNLRGAKYYQ